MMMMKMFMPVNKDIMFKYLINLFLFLVHAKNARKWRKRRDSWKYCWEKRAGTKYSKGFQQKWMKMEVRIDWLDIFPIGATQTVRGQTKRKRKTWKIFKVKDKGKRWSWKVQRQGEFHNFIFLIKQLLSVQTRCHPDPERWGRCQLWWGGWCFWTQEGENWGGSCQKWDFLFKSILKKTNNFRSKTNCRKSHERPHGDGEQCEQLEVLVNCYVGAIFVSLIKITCIDPAQFAIITGFTQHS